MPPGEGGGAAELAVLRAEVDDLKVWRTSFAAEMLAAYNRLSDKIDRALLGRPSWAVTIVIQLLTAALATETTFLATRR
jgi:hypothetical protein